MTAITDLEIFARVARTGNMSAAGREMKFSPAVVSKRISLLEERLGTRLFQRTTRQLTLTEAGEGFYERIVNILDLVDQAEDFVSTHNTSAKGTLKIAAPTSFSRMHVVPHLSGFMTAYPDIEIDLQLSDDFVDIIANGYDAAIRIGELKDSTMVARKLANEDRMLCATPDYIKRHGRPKTLQDLNSHNCLTFGAQDHWRLEGPDGAKSYRPRGKLRTNSAELVREAMLAGLGIALCPAWDVAQLLKSGELKTVLPKYSGSSNVAIHAIYPSRDFVPVKVHAFIDFLADIYANDPYWKKKNINRLKAA
ncbi:MAG: LysR family transcriptional regulator [Hyphomicrobiaceae bacterium]